MSFWDFMIGALVVRQMFVLSAIVRSRRFFKGEEQRAASGQNDSPPVFYVVVPVLREAAELRKAVAHFNALIEGHSARLVVVTTARETAEASQYPNVGDTMAVAEELARDGSLFHLHYPDHLGLKADQLNMAVDFCMSTLSEDVPSDRAFLVVYDVDSRPPLDSLEHFATAIARHPEASVFHQSSRFEFRPSRIGRKQNLLHYLGAALVDSGALRANRFVLAYEIPRLLNRLDYITGAFKARVCSFVYAHVTGHGLCIRVPLLQEMPFPPRSPLEDMHYSFLLDAKGFQMIPIKSLDRAGMPDSVDAHFEQLARWFFGPARFFRYLADPAIGGNSRARLLAVSAAGISLGWLSCAFVPTLLLVLFISRNSLTRSLIGTLLGLYFVQLVVVDQSMGFPDCIVNRAWRVLLYPLVCTFFGVAGFVGAIRLVRGESGAGKTERWNLL